MKHHPAKPKSGTKPEQKPSPPLRETGRHQRPSRQESGHFKRTPEGTIEESHEEQAP